MDRDDPIDHLIPFEKAHILTLVHDDIDAVSQSRVSDTGGWYSVFVRGFEEALEATARFLFGTVINIVTVREGILVFLFMLVDSHESGGYYWVTILPVLIPRGGRGGRRAVRRQLPLGMVGLAVAVHCL